jgi:hypothetical protein
MTKIKNNGQSKKVDDISLATSVGGLNPPIHDKFDYMIMILESILRNQLKLAKAILYQEDIQLEYLIKEEELKSSLGKGEGK